MDRDRKANTRCTWFTQIGYVHGIEEFSLIVKGLHKYIGSSSPLVDVASSLEVLFLHPGVVSLTGGDAQGVPQVAELGGLLKEVTDKSIRPTEEFEGQNKSIKSRVRSTLLIWDTFAFDRVMGVSARVLLRLSPHASLYPSHLPYLFLKQMRNLPWKHKMLKMSTREQCQYSLFAEVLSGGKKAEYFERLRWECPLRYDERLSIFAGLPSTLKKWSVVSGSRDSENDAFSIFEKAIMLGSTLPRSTKVDTQRLSNYPAMVLFLYPLFAFEKVVMLGVWLSRFGGRCLFDFGASNLVGSVFSKSDVVGAASFTCSTLAENFGKVICGTHELLLRVGSADKARKVGASSISEIGPRESNHAGGLALEDSGSSVSSIFEKVITLGVWLSRFGGRCLFDFGASNLVGSVFSNSCWESGSRDSEDGASSILEQAILLGVFSRINSTVPLPLWSDVVGAASFTCSTLAENFGKVICEVFDRMPIISAKLSVRVTGADKAGKVGASSISEIGPRGLWGAQLLRKRAPLRFLRSAFVAPLRFPKLRRVQIFIEADIKFQSTLESPPVEASFLHF
ncbi:hypothetical protein COP1_010969 [Malus domestica]